MEDSKMIICENIANNRIFHRDLYCFSVNREGNVKSLNNEGAIFLSDILKKNSADWHLRMFDRVGLNNVKIMFRMNKSFQVVNTRINNEPYILICILNNSCSEKENIVLIYQKDLELGNQHSLQFKVEDILESLYDGIYITDINSITIMANKAYENITGIKNSDILGKDVKELVSKGYFDKSVSELVRRTKKRVTLPQRYSTGKEVLVTGNPIYNKKGDVELVVSNIRDMTELNELNRSLRRSWEIVSEYKNAIQSLQTDSDATEELICASESMVAVYELIKKVTDTDATVLIYGETGVGKDRIAKLIHSNSKRSQTGIFVKINCGALPDSLLESELFGYEGGAFTGAKKEGKMGLFEIANKGTLFLDEVGSMSLTMQSKLLNAIQDYEIQRVGGTKTIKIDIRLICACNEDLKDLISKNQFRSDLYYRLNVIPVYIPPLRERIDDIKPLCDLYLRKFNAKYSKSKMFTNKTANMLKEYRWPGNVRELANLIERLVVVSLDNQIDSCELPLEIIRNVNENILIDSTKTFNLSEYIRNIEFNIIKKTVAQYGSSRKAAAYLGVDASTITRKLQKGGAAKSHHTY